jgi:hypothetical protein
VILSEKVASSNVTSLSSFLTAIKATNGRELAQKQLPVLKSFAEQTDGNPGLKEFNKYYLNWAKEISYLARQ